MKYLAVPISSLLLVAGAASAQEAAPPPAETEGPAAPAASAAVPEAAASVTDAEVDSFAKATVQLQAIQADATIADDQKQAKMQEAVSSSGLDPAKYNAIGKAAQADPELRARVQTAMAKHAGHDG